MATIIVNVTGAVHMKLGPILAPAVKYVLMAEGSSSAAPVISLDSGTRPETLVPVRGQPSGDAPQGAAPAEGRASRVCDVDALVS
jgi:hypothetical protein